MEPAQSHRPTLIGHTAGFHTLRDIPVAVGGETAGDIQARLAQRRYDLVDPIFLCDAGAAAAGPLPLDRYPGGETVAAGAGTGAR